MEAAPTAECLDGARVCPPEDCGGAPGYAHLLELLAGDDPEHPDIEWALGPDHDFDPERFDIARVNDWLARIFRSSPGR